MYLGNETLWIYKLHQYTSKSQYSNTLRFASSKPKHLKVPIQVSTFDMLREKIANHNFP